MDSKTEHTYLEITLQNKMSWASHINSIVNKTSRTLNFLKCNLSRCSQKDQRICTYYQCSSFIRICIYCLGPIATSLWKKVQRISARWVRNTYSNATTMIESLKWNTLREHRKTARLPFFMITSVVNIPQHALPIKTTRHTHHHHPNSP